MIMFVLIINGEKNKTYTDGGESRQKENATAEDKNTTKKDAYDQP